MGKTKKNARLPMSTLYGKSGKKFTRKHHYKSSKNKSMNFPQKSQTGSKAFLQIREELVGDNNPQKNMVTFVTVKPLDKYQDKIMHDLQNVNFIDTTVYPKVKKMEQDMVKMMGDLFNDANNKECRGISTIGSSEAIYVSTILHKFKWEERHKKDGTKSFNKNLNAIYSFNTHVNWDKATRWNYIQQQKILPKPNDPDSYVFGAKEVEERINKDTICVICTLATTRTGQNDKIREINDFLVDYHKKTGVFVPIHVDAAIGGFIAPFVNPSLVWDFRLPHVKSMNVSFHKYGGTFCGMGMAIVASDYSLPDKFRFFFNVEKKASAQKGGEHTSTNKNSKKIHRLSEGTGASSGTWGHNYHKDPHASGKSHTAKTTYNKQTKFIGELDDWYINFSKPSSQIVSAYYLFQRLGFEGYKKRMEDSIDVAKYISNYINKITSYNDPSKLVFKQINEPYYPEIAFKLDDYNFPLTEILTTIEKNGGYSVAAYKLDPSVPDIVFRLVVKPTFTHENAKDFINVLNKAILKHKPKRSKKTRKKKDK